MEQRHLTALQAKHADLDARIAEETRRPSPDDMLVAQMKKRKLVLKQEMGRN